MNSRLCSSAIWLALIASFSVFAQEVTVTDWGASDTETFDPAHPPPDLPAGEDADATPFVKVSGAAHNGTWDGTEYTVGEVGPVTAEGHTRIRLPTDADNTLKGHENGHDALNKNEYDKNAKRKIDEAMKGFKGMKFKGEGANDAARQADALAKASAERDRRLNRARDAILAQMETLNEKYDTLTAHGTSDKVNTEEGKKQAVAERDKAPDADKHGFAPSPVDPLASGFAFAAFDPDGTRLSIGGPLGGTVIQQTSFPGDPLQGAGLLMLDPFVPIGLTASGAMHVSDATVHLLDRSSGRELLTAYLFEVAYKPSSLPGFAGMVQGYLDVPPDFTGALENFIGSPFLEGLRDAADAGRMTTLWFFAQAPLFDAAGQPVGDASGLALIGIGVPEPDALLLLAAGLLALRLMRRLGRP